MRPKAASGRPPPAADLPTLPDMPRTHAMIQIAKTIVMTVIEAKTTRIINNTANTNITIIYDDKNKNK